MLKDKHSKDNIDLTMQIMFWYTLKKKKKNTSIYTFTTFVKS